MAVPAILLALWIIFYTSGASHYVAHALLSASGAKRWILCPPSARLEEKLKERMGEKSSPFAEEGTKAHSLSELKLLREKGKLGHEDGINEFNYQARRKALGEIPEEMDQKTDEYVDAVMEVFMAARRRCPDAKLLLEIRVDFSRWVPQGFGTSDVVIVADNELTVIDLKYGKGVRIDAMGNPQARCYGLGALAVYDELYDIRKVHIMIIQPRLDHITEETLTTEALLQWADEVLAPAAQLAWKGEGEFNPGDHCRFCAARGICFARASQALQVLSSSMETPGVLPEEEIPKILEVADVAMDWFKDLKSYALSQALNGHRYYGYKLVRGKKPPRAWRDEEKAVEQLIRAGYDENLYQETKLKSVSKIEKAVGKTAFNAIFSDLVFQGEGAYTLVPETDGRPEINPADADFADLTE